MIAAYTLCVPEVGEKDVLEVDCHGLVERGVGPEQVGSGCEPLSDATIDAYAVPLTPTTQPSFAMR